MSTSEFPLGQTAAVVSVSFTYVKGKNCVSAPFICSVHSNLSRLSKKVLKIAILESVSVLGRERKREYKESQNCCMDIYQVTEVKRLINHQVCCF